MKKKLLIIKLGWSETLDPEISRTSSLGDILRSTVILHQLRDYHIAWLVDEKAVQLIEDNPFIQRPIIFREESYKQLAYESFDTVINFEKVPELCQLADKIQAELHLGFAYDPVSGEAIARPGMEQVFRLCKNPEEKRSHQVSWQKTLVEAVGGEWKGQEYILGYKTKSPVKYDFGLNHVVGPKWPTKNWPLGHWQKLAVLLEAQGYSVSWQKGLADLREYMDWIHSCKTLITCDSLGFHLSLALKKRTIVLYGPTNAHETYLYGRGIAIQPKGFSCAPCMSPVCKNDRFCMENISVEEVFRKAIPATIPAENQVWV